MNDKDTTSAADERIPWEELGLSPKDLMDDTSLSKPESNNNTLKPVLAFGIGAAVVINVGFLSSLPPVLRGKGT